MCDYSGRQCWNTCLISFAPKILEVETHYRARIKCGSVSFLESHCFYTNAHCFAKLCFLCFDSLVNFCLSWDGIVGLHVSHPPGVLLFSCPRKTTRVGFCKSTKIGPLGFEAWRVARGFCAQTSETYTCFSRDGCASMVRGSPCNIRCLGTRGLVTNPGWWTIGKCSWISKPDFYFLNRICAKCGVQNFRRRDACFKCSGPRTEYDTSNEAEDEVCDVDEICHLHLFRAQQSKAVEKVEFPGVHPSNQHSASQRSWRAHHWRCGEWTIVWVNFSLNFKVIQVLNTLGPLTKLPLKSVRVARDSLTSMSRGVCYVEMNSVVDAMFLHNQLLANPPAIEGKIVEVSGYFLY